MRLRTTLAAEQDLLGIWNYIATDSPSAADRMLERIQSRFELLLQAPLSGESQSRYRAGLRSIVEGPYIVFYEFRAEEILIYRILHGARSWEDLISD